MKYSDGCIEIFFHSVTYIINYFYKNGLILEWDYVLCKGAPKFYIKQNVTKIVGNIMITWVKNFFDYRISHFRDSLVNTVWYALLTRFSFASSTINFNLNHALSNTILIFIIKTNFINQIHKLQ